MPAQFLRTDYDKATDAYSAIRYFRYAVSTWQRSNRPG